MGRENKHIQNTTNVEFICVLENVEFSVLFLKYPLPQDGLSELETAEGERPRHVHNYYEIIFIEDDASVKFETKEKQISLRKNDVVLVSPHCEHLFRGIEKQKAYKLGFTIHQKKGTCHRVLKDLISWLKTTEYDMFNDTEGMKVLINALCSGMTGIGAHYRMSACFTNLIFYLYEKFSKSKGRECVEDGGFVMERGQEDVIANALMFHYATDIRAEDVAAQIFLSPRQVNRICHKMYGKTFREQKEAIRINIAKKLLTKTSKNILNISLECGFNSIGSFYLAFSRLENIPPNKYRKLHKRKES